MGNDPRSGYAGMQARPEVAVIGLGKIGCSLVAGLLKCGYGRNALFGAETAAERREYARDSFGIRVYEDAAAAVECAGKILLAVKPRHVPAVAHAIARPAARNEALAISVAAGIRLSSLRAWLGEGCTIVRAMPNTPAAVGASITVLCADPGVAEAQREAADGLLRSVGTVFWVEDEALLDTVTAVSGSGPAYYFLVMEAMIAAAEEGGLSAEQARLLVYRTAGGSAELALQSKRDVASLRQEVSSPGGTTEAAIQTLLDGGMPDLIRAAVRAARDRSRELSEPAADTRER